MKRNKGAARDVTLLHHQKRDRKRLKSLRLAQKRRVRIKKVLAEYVTLRCPDFLTISLGDHRRQLIHFLNRLRAEVLINRNNVRIDFTRTKRIICDGGILLRAEIELIALHKAPSIKIKCVTPKENKTTQVLNQIDVFRLLNHKASVAPKDDDVINWKCAHGSANEGEKYDVVLGSYDGELAEETQTRLYYSFTEAMDNAISHAYIKERDDGVNITPTSKHWWMFSQKKDGYLTVVFCDLGIGIPNSLPYTKPNLFQKLWQHVVGKRDGDIIEATIHEGRTRTGATYRGRGLNQVIRALEDLPDTTIHVWSNYGRYSRINNNSKTENYRESIKGTLISWQLPIGSP